MNIDDVYSHIGQFGPQQKKYMGVSFVALGFYAAVATFNQQFACWEPSFQCVHQNGSQLTDRCFDGRADNCVSLVFNTSYTTVVTEWRLVCDRSWQPRSAQSAFMLGLVVSALLSGPLSDRFGRLRLVCVMAATSLLTVLTQALAGSVEVYIVARLVNGALHMGVVLSGFVLQQELVGPEYRAMVGNLSGCFFSGGLMLLSVIAWACRSWRLLYGVTVVLGCAVPMLWLYIPESPRWLLVRGHRDRAVHVLRQIAAGNGRPLTRDLSDLRSPRDGDSEDICTLLRTRRGALWTGIQMLTWFTVNLGFYSLTAATGTVGGDRFVNFAIAGFVDLPAHLLIYFILDRFGRRRCLCGLYVGGALGCLGVLVLPAADRGRLGGRTACLWLGKLMMSAVFTTVYVHTLEIFPTSVRNRGISVINAWARLSGLFYPFMVTLDSVLPSLQYAVLAALMLLSGGLALLLPETAGRPLFATVAQLVGSEAGPAPLHGLLRDDRDRMEAVPLTCPLSADSPSGSPSGGPSGSPSGGPGQQSGRWDGRDAWRDTQQQQTAADGWSDQEGERWD